MDTQQQPDTTSGSISRELAEFIVGLRAQDPPESVMHRMSLHVLDTLGCQLAFATLPWSQNIWAYVQSRESTGPSTVAFHGVKIAPELAAFANASFTHGFEMDDVDMLTTSHPGSVIVPAALAIAQKHSATGKEFLTAVVAGYESMIRIALGGVGMPYRGFHTSAVVGGFGAAAAAALLEGLDVDQTAHALGICASRAGGISEFAISGGMEKRLHGAYGAQVGLEAVGLAKSGVTAPLRPIEGKRGLLNAVTDTPAPERITPGLGSQFLAENTGLKRYCCCGGQHSTLDAVSELVALHGIRPEQIARIKVRLNPREYDAVSIIKRPTDVISSQFSVAFGIGLLLVNGSNGFRDYTEAQLDDERILAIADKVHCERLEPTTLLEGDGPSEVEITLTTGEVYGTYASHPRGSSRYPLTEAEVVTKFLGLAADVLGDERAARVVDLVLGLEELPDIGLLADELVVRDEYQPRDYSHLLGVAKELVAGSTP